MGIYTVLPAMDQQFRALTIKVRDDDHSIRPDLSYFGGPADEAGSADDS